MNAIMVPIMQHDFVTKKEFGEFKDEMSEFRSEVNDRFNDVDSRFEDLKSEIGIFKTEIKEDMNKHQEEIKGYFDRSIGVMYDKFHEDVLMSMEYIQGIDKNKVDARDFEVVRQQVASLIDKRKK